MKPFTKDGRVGILRETVTEGAGYRLKAVLALMDLNGNWLLSCSWRSNAWKKAERELGELGWSPTTYPRAHA